MTRTWLQVVCMWAAFNAVAVAVWAAILFAAGAVNRRRWSRQWDVPVPPARDRKEVQ